MGDVYTRAEVAERLKVSSGTIKRLLRSGELPSFRVGSQYRVTAEQLKAYMERTRGVDA